MNNSEFLRGLMKRADGSLQAWFDAEHTEGSKAASNLQWMVDEHRDVVVEALSELGLWCTKPPYPCLHRDDERGCETCRGEDVPARIAEWLTAEHVDGTNGDGDGTNGIAGDVPLVEPCTSEGEKVQGLPDDNVLYLLRDVAKKSDGHTLYHGITKLMQAIGKEPEDKRETGSELAVALNTLADMVERDYVKRESIEAVMDTDRELVAENIRLTAERDELKAMNDRLQVALDAVEGCDERCKKLEADRDGWKAKAEHYGDHVDRLMEAIRDLARKQPLTFDPEAPYKNAELVGKYIDELKAKAEIAERAMNAAAGKLARANAELRRDGGAPTLGDLYGILGGEEPHEEPDSREKLEADVRFRFGAWGDSPLCDEVFGWLDRQAEITKREWAHVNDAYIADVRAERNAAESRAAELEAEISKRDKGIERLKRQRDEARADLEAFAGMPSALAPSEHERVVDRLQRENIGLARDLAECSREREAYRRACGQLLDLADQMRLVRLDGCGEELADGEGEVVS